MSCAKRSRMPGRSTLIATVGLVVTPRWTCAIEAEPTATGSISANTSPIGRSKARVSSVLDLHERHRRQLSCSVSRLCAASSPTRSAASRASGELDRRRPIAWKAAA
jgi:hypothetical protein